MTTEAWKPVPGWTMYEVSDLGRVRSLYTDPPTDRRPYRGQAGHLYVILAEAPRRRGIQVHRLVLMAFAGPCPDGMEACHGNGDPTDNRLANLRWDTKGANLEDCYRHSVARGDYTNGRARLTQSQALAIFTRASAGEDRAALATEYGITAEKVHRIVRGNDWYRVTGLTPKRPNRTKARSEYPAGSRRRSTTDTAS